MIAKDFALEVKTPAAAAALHADPEMGFIRGYVHGEIEVHCAPPYHLGYALDFAEQGAPQAFGARIRQTLSRGQWWLHQVFRPYGPGLALARRVPLCTCHAEWCKARCRGCPQGAPLHLVQWVE